MLLFCKRFDVWRLVLVINPTFASISIDIGKLVDGESVLFVKCGAMKSFGSSNGLLGGLVFNKGEANPA